MVHDGPHASTSRFFRAYVAFEESHSRDALFQWLEAMHSMWDRLKSHHDVDLLDFDEFKALKCLRNYFHHHAELKHILKVIHCSDVALISDLLVVCLVPLEQVQAALMEENAKYRQQVQSAMISTFRQYGEVFNINPSVFNLVSRVSLRLAENDMEPVACSAYEHLRSSMDFETQNGYSHFVTGDLRCHAGDVELVLEQLMTVED